MGDGDVGLGDIGAHEFRRLVQIGDARADIEHLAAAPQFALQRLAHDNAVERQNKGSHRQPVHRRRGDQTQFAHPGQRHLQRARYRRRRQSQDVDVRPHLLQAFLVGDAESLLLVNDQQPQIGEYNVLSQQRMGADDDVDRAGDKFAPGLGRFRGLVHPRESGDPQRPSGEPLAKRPQMLPHQQRGRRDDRDLLARHCRNERRPQCHLGLAEADIAANQAIHRRAGGEIGEHLGDGALLVFGLGVRKPRAKLGIGAGRNRQPRGFAHRPCRRDTQQVTGDFADALLRPGHARLPGAAPQAVQARRAFVAAVSGDDLDVLDRHEHPVAAVIGQHRAIVGLGVDGDRLQALESPDAVVHVHDQVAGRQCRDFADEVLRLPPAPRRPGDAFAEDILLRQHRKFGRLKAAFEAQHRHRHRGFGQALDLGPVRRVGEWADSVIQQQPGQPFPRAVGYRGDDDAAAARAQGINVVAHRVQHQGAAFGRGADALGGEVAPRPGPHVLAASVLPGPVPAAGQLVERRKLHDRPRAQRRRPFGVGHRQAIGRQRPVGDRVGPVRSLQTGRVIVRDQGQPRGAGLLDSVGEHHRRLGQQREQRVQTVVEQRQPVFRPGVPPPGRYRRIHRVIGADGPEPGLVGGAKPGDRFRVQPEFPGRDQTQGRRIAGRALGQRVKRPDRFQPVAEQIQPQRLRRPGREYVQQAAAHRVLARLPHRSGAGIAVPGQQRLEIVEVDGIAGTGVKTARRQRRPRRHPLQRRIDRRQHYAGRGRRRRVQNPQRVHAPGQHRDRRRHAVIRHAVPGRKCQHLQLRRKEAQRVKGRLHRLGALLDLQHRAGPGGAGDGRHRQRREGVGDAAEPRHLPLRKR